MAKTALHRQPDERRLGTEETERQARRLQWQAEHREFITAYNQVVEEEGLPLESWRMF